jgi:riboflavin synthase
MFTGIIETVGTLEEVISDESNKTLWINSQLSNNLKVDQSVSHNGVCLTIEEIKNGSHRVTAVAETLQKTSLMEWWVEMPVNIERCLAANGRLDGHFVQGHVDTVGRCVEIVEKQGSRELVIEFPKHFAPLVIEKGSIALDGISLTTFDVGNTTFKVAVIPFTLAHTNLHACHLGQQVNLEFDMIGKYIQRRITTGYLR